MQGPVGEPGAVGPAGSSDAVSMPMLMFVPGAERARGCHCLPAHLTHKTRHTGVPGVWGRMGLAGLRGSQGNPGLPGPAGVSGRDGVAGAAGAPGIFGPVGPPGDRGGEGQRGPSGLGLVGAPGANGAPGAPGMQGAPGSNGANGVLGANGAPVIVCCCACVWSRRRGWCAGVGVQSRVSCSGFRVGGAVEQSVKRADGDQVGTAWSRVQGSGFRLVPSRMYTALTLHL